MPHFIFKQVNTSGQFVGLAEMVGPVDFERTVGYWQQDKWTGCFPLKWHIIKDIPNVVLRHITLENNENKPVTNSRDTQEVLAHWLVSLCPVNPTPFVLQKAHLYPLQVKFEKGIQILKIFKGHGGKTCILDDFEFYEAREKMIQERKSKEHRFSKHVRCIFNFHHTHLT